MELFKNDIPIADLGNPDAIYFIAYMILIQTGNGIVIFLGYQIIG